jgi:Flp pilus assembly pilin Flp
MGIPEDSQQLSDAAGRSAAYSDALRSAVAGFVRDRRGVTAIEYGIMVCMMTLAIVGAISTLGNQTFVQLFSKIASSM